MWPLSVNMTYVNIHKDLIFELIYDQKQDFLNKTQFPSIHNWEFVELNQFFFDLKINFSEPL